MTVRFERDFKVVDGPEVKSGQVSIPFNTHNSALRMVSRLCRGDYKGFSTQVGPREAGIACVIRVDGRHPFVGCSATEPELRRRDLKHGDCFQYLHTPTPHIVVGRGFCTGDALKGAPDGWFASHDDRDDRTVVRIPHWNAVTTDPVTPVIRSCIDPLDRRLSTVVGGLDGRECLRRLEIAMRAESVTRLKDGSGHTSNGGGGLTAAQFAHGQACWSATVHARRVATVEKERYRVVCDDVDEMPNLRYEE